VFGAYDIAMPTLSFFYGIQIVMYWSDHPPPHFHAKIAGQSVVINVLTLQVIKGDLPPNLFRLVLLWAEQHQQELMEAWEKCRKQEQPQKIAPLP
jgi:hypothetical protein